MLPFLKKSKEASVSAPVEHIRRESDHEDDGHEGPMSVVAEELIYAVHKRDTRGVIDALHAAFMILDAMPHVEGEHLDHKE
jgi:hypothetical protein